MDSILEAAARVFEEQGYETATTNRIAEVAGVSIGSVYQYFPNKNALLTGLHERHLRLTLALLEAASEAAPQRSLRESVEWIVAGSLDIHRVQPRLQRVLHAELATLQRDAESSEGSRAVHEATHRLLTRHEREIQRQDLELAAFMVLRISEELIHAALLQAPDGADEDALERSISDAIVGYLQA